MASLRSPNRKRSSAEIEAIALISQGLLELERLKWAADDVSIASLAQAIDALELGAYDSARRLAGQARTEHIQPPDTSDRAHAIVQALALDHLKARFLRLAARGGAAAASPPGDRPFPGGPLVNFPPPR